jgi:hypothetical protein
VGPRVDRYKNKIKKRCLENFVRSQLGHTYTCLFLVVENVFGRIWIGRKVIKVIETLALRDIHADSRIRTSAISATDNTQRQRRGGGGY